MGSELLQKALEAGGVETLGEPLDGGDATMAALMRDNFGPPKEEEGGAEQMQRGLEAVADLTKATIDGGKADGSPQWRHEDTEGLMAPPPLPEPRLCFACAKPSVSKCAKCGVAAYCSRECQTADWKKSGAWGGHKALCPGYKVLGRDQDGVYTDASQRRAALERLVASVRLYLCPFAVAHGSGGASKARPKPRGCAFLQLGCTVATIALPCPRDCAGHNLPPGERSCLLHWVTLAEYDDEIAPTDAALGRARGALAEAIEDHDDASEVVVLLRAADGFVGLLIQPLVPDMAVCKALASEYEGREALQLDVDTDIPDA